MIPLDIFCINKKQTNFITKNIVKELSISEYWTKKKDRLYSIINN